MAVNPFDSFDPEIYPPLVAQLTCHDLYRLLKQAVRDGTLEANSKTSTNRADSVAKQLLGG